MQQRAQFYADCAGTPNRSCLTPYDVMHYNDVKSAWGSYVFRRNMRFIDVWSLKSFSVQHIDLKNFLNVPRIHKMVAHIRKKHKQRSVTW